MKRKAFSCSKAEYKREGNKLSIRRKTFGVAEAAQNVIGGAAETAGGRLGGGREPDFRGPALQRGSGGLPDCLLGREKIRDAAG